MLKVFLTALMLGLILPSMAAASEFELGIAPVWWQYQESSGKRQGFATTALDSSASSYGLELSAGLSQAMGDQWLLKADWKGMSSLNQSNEHWTLGNGIQNNDLSIKQSEFNASILRNIYGIRVGVLSAYQWQQQSRKNIVLNGVKKSIGTINETVQVLWGGLALQSSSFDKRFVFDVDVAVPVWVHVANDNVQGTFNRRTGYRIGSAFTMGLPFHLLDTESKIRMSYQYRQLGNDLKTNALWPKNSWQQVSVGAVLGW